MNLTTGMRERVRTWLPRNELLKRYGTKTIKRERKGAHL